MEHHRKKAHTRWWSTSWWRHRVGTLAICHWWVSRCGFEYVLTIFSAGVRVHVPMIANHTNCCHRSSQSLLDSLCGVWILSLWLIWFTKMSYRRTTEFVDAAFPWYMRPWNLVQRTIGWKAHCGHWILAYLVSILLARKCLTQRWNVFKVKYAMSGGSLTLSSYESRSNSYLEPTLAPGLLKKLFGCQANEKVFPPLKEILL